MTGCFTLHLARHLPTVPRATGLIDHVQFAELLADDAQRTVVPGASVEPSLIAAAGASQRLISSTLLRAEETVRVIQRALGPGGPPTERWSELVEAGQPALAWPRVRLPEGAWSAVSRAAWALGEPGDGESLGLAEDRARRAVERLTALSAPGFTLTVVAHGCFNILMARELRRRGWRGPLLPDVRPAHFSTYRRSSLYDA